MINFTIYDWCLIIISIINNFVVDDHWLQSLINQYLLENSTICDWCLIIISIINNSIINDYWLQWLINQYLMTNFIIYDWCLIIVSIINNLTINDYWLFIFLLHFRTPSRSTTSPIWRTRTIPSCSTSCSGSPSSSCSLSSPSRWLWATSRTKTPSSTAWLALAARRTTKPSHKSLNHPRDSSLNYSSCAKTSPTFNLNVSKIILNIYQSSSSTSSGRKLS